MKTSFKYIVILAATSALLTVTSCKKTFYTSVNTNPDALVNAPLNTILPVVETGLAYAQGGNQSLYTSLLMQQTEGITFQAQAYYQYNFTNQDFETQWDEMYTNAMENDYTLMNLADSKGANEYSGIARILMAYSLQTMVDCWGSIPYSKSFQGSSDLTPTYDNDQTLYANIGTLISQGISYLGEAPGGTAPSNDDVIYGGNAQSWIAFAHAINARVAIHQSKNNSAMASTALTEVTNANTNSFATAQVIFGTTQSNANPWYQFIQNRVGYVSFAGSTLATELSTLNDPRYSAFIDTTGAQDNLAAFYGSSNSPVEFITPEELLFITAEATVTSSGSVTGAAVTAYDSAIAVNMEKLGIAHSAIATYIAANPLPTSTTSAAITQIGLQEWIALYLNPEEFAVWRRTGSPTLTPPSGAKYNVVPRRFLYPQSELSYNGANTPNATLFAPKVFWDN